MKQLKIIIMFFLVLITNEVCFSQSTGTNSYRSNKYRYTITIPLGFKQTVASGKNIDLKLVHADGTSIIINVTPRRPEEYKITAHDYSKEMFEQEFKQYSPSVTISKAEKLYLAGEKAFLINYVNSSNSTKAIEIYTFKGDNAYVFTATTKVNQFQKLEAMFLKTFNSFKF